MQIGSLCSLVDMEFLEDDQLVMSYYCTFRRDHFEGICGGILYFIFCILYVPNYQANNFSSVQGIQTTSKDKALASHWMFNF